MERAVRVVTALALLLFPGSNGEAAAQDGLVLSGGGARGLAHAGVLVALEEQGYDPDVVVGASMGAVVGSLYAAGYGADEIVALFRSVDWRQIFAPQTVLAGPERDPRYPVLHFSRPPGGTFGVRQIVPDWRINRLLVRHLFGPLAAARGDFDRLPRRFRAVAADLRHLERFAPAEGNLPLIVRASLSAPGFFAPVRWGDRWLMDGGARDYLPVDIARELGAGHVVAVDVVAAPDTLTSLSAPDVARRALRLLLRQVREPGAGAPDVLIQPPLDPDLSAAAFPADPASLIAMGRAGAEEERFAARTGGEHRRRTHRSRAPAPPSIARREVVAATPALERLVRRAFDSVAPGASLEDAVLRAVDRLYATGLFQGVWPYVEVDSLGEGVLRVGALRFIRVNSI
ncbi:MAG: patatin-like phospholipase family protein, partial [Gemmatimonadota bacterium]